MKAIILSAGQGRRLLPWTHDIPKCLLSFAGRSLLSWQLQSVADAGVTEAIVVAGFGALGVEHEIARTRPAGLSVDIVRNPFFGVADNIASVWLVRDLLVGDVAVINGDTLFGPDLLAKLYANSLRPLTLALDRKDHYDADDVKVRLDGDRVTRIGKKLDGGIAESEFIGILVCKGLGGPLFGAAVEKVIDRPGGAGRWYLAALDDLAAKGFVGGTSIAGSAWTEVDYPSDLGRAEMLTRGWTHKALAARRVCPVAQ